MSKFDHEIGLKPINCNMSIEYVASIDGTKLSVKELEKIMTSIASYALFLDSRKGSLLAEIKYMRGTFDIDLYRESAKLSSKYNSSYERVSVALSINNDLARRKKELTLLDMKYAKVRNCVDRVLNVLDILKSIYYRKAREMRKIEG